MTAIRALLVDDEQTARDNVRALLAREPRWQVIGECEDADGLRRTIAEVVPDVVFLDIRLPGGDGVEIARLLQQLAPRPLVIFITAYEHYAVSAFEVQAIDYLLKPFDDARFAMALRRAEEALGEPAASGRYAQRLVIRSIGRVQFVEVAQIDWLEASGNYVEVHTAGQSFLHRERLRVLEQQLDPAEFVRIHRSIIVHRSVVKELRPLAGGDYSVLVNGGTALRLSRTYRGALDLLARDR
jgi:two-component system LytT family response regulator